MGTLNHPLDLSVVPPIGTIVHFKPAHPSSSSPKTSLEVQILESIPQALTRNGAKVLFWTCFIFLSNLLDVFQVMKKVSEAKDDKELEEIIYLEKEKRERRCGLGTRSGRLLKSIKWLRS